MFEISHCMYCLNTTALAMSRVGHLANCQYLNHLRNRSLALQQWKGMSFVAAIQATQAMSQAMAISIVSINEPKRVS